MTYTIQPTPLIRAMYSYVQPIKTNMEIFQQLIFRRGRSKQRLIKFVVSRDNLIKEIPYKISDTGLY